MKFRNLGKSGTKVSEIALGTMTFGVQCDETTSFAIMDRAAEGGVNFIDTADCYPVPLTQETAGQTEEIIGRWLRGKRGRFVVATKCFFPMGAGPNDRGNSRPPHPASRGRKPAPAANGLHRFVPGPCFRLARPLSRRRCEPSTT